MVSHHERIRILHLRVFGKEIPEALCGMPIGRPDLALLVALSNIAWDKLSHRIYYYTDIEVFSDE